MTGNQNHRILLVLCGGTICTAAGEKAGLQVLSIRERPDAELIRNYKSSGSRFAKSAAFTTSENFGILSENMTIAKWNLLIDYFRSVWDSLPDYDGIVVAHGTDTLAYSAALFAQLFSGISVPVFFVSSNMALDTDGANGNDNFRLAADCICMGVKPGVYVPYRNISDGKMLLHLASRITQCRSYEEDFHSMGAVYIPDIDQIDLAACDSLSDAETENAANPVTLAGGWRLTNAVLKIDPYVGLDYRAYRYSLFKAVLHGTYHSGTACAERTDSSPDYGSASVLSMLDVCLADPYGPEVVISPSRIDPDTRIYETAEIMYHHAAGSRKPIFLYGFTDETVYAKLLLYYSASLAGRVPLERYLNETYNLERLPL